ncbi:MAG: hypothetical protein WC856_02580 [Methylococcaceae bacterium]
MKAIQTTIVGYSGKPCSLFSVYDNEAKVLVISVEAGYRRERRQDCMVITNDPDIERDGLFSEAELKESISAFFAMQAGVAIDGKSNRLVFSDKAARANPSQSIEKDGMDANGQRYRISESITCAQIAALATCWYADTRYGTVEKVLDMADSIRALEHLHYGGIWTI